MMLDDVGTTAPPRSDLARQELRVLSDHRGRGGVLVAVPEWAAIGDAPLGLPTLALAATALQREGSRLHLPGDVVAWREGSLVWLRTAVPSAPIVVERRSTPGALDGLAPAADPGTGRLVWAFADERAGDVVARAFVASDHENDAVAFPGAAVLAGQLRRPLLVRSRTGSVVVTRPAPRRRVELGARVTPIDGVGELLGTAERGDGRGVRGRRRRR